MTPFHDLRERQRAFDERWALGRLDDPLLAASARFARFGESGEVRFVDPAAGVVKDGVNESAMTATFVISTASQDRDRDVLEPRGCEKHLDAFRKNPVVFFGHQLFPLPVATARAPDGSIALAVEDGRVLSTAHFHGRTPESDDVFMLVALKVLNAASVGFLPLLAERIAPPPAPRDGQTIDFAHTGYHFLEWELLEWSVVGVQSNRDAVQMSLGKCRSPRVRETMTRLAGPVEHFRAYPHSTSPPMDNPTPAPAAPADKPAETQPVSLAVTLTVTKDMGDTPPGAALLMGVKSLLEKGGPMIEQEHVKKFCKKCYKHCRATWEKAYPEVEMSWPHDEESDSDLDEEPKPTDGDKEALALLKSARRVLAIVKDAAAWLAEIGRGQHFASLSAKAAAAHHAGRLQEALAALGREPAESPESLDLAAIEAALAPALQRLDQLSRSVAGLTGAAD